MTVHGIDISHWQSFFRPEIAQVNGDKFAIFKASQSTWTDRMFIQYHQDAGRAGMIRGMYHYMDFTKPPKEQAFYFAGIYRLYPTELPPILDYECRAGIPGDAGRVRTWCKDFLEELREECGRTPILYTSPGYWREFGSADYYWAQYPLWLAHYGVDEPTVPRPWNRWHLWQYTDKGIGANHGVGSAQVDCNYWHGTIDELRTFCSVGPRPPAPPPEPSTDAEIPEAEKVARLWAAHPELHVTTTPVPRYSP